MSASCSQSRSPRTATLYPSLTDTRQNCGSTQSLLVMATPAEATGQGLTPVAGAELSLATHGWPESVDEINEPN